VHSRDFAWVSYRRDSKSCGLGGSTPRNVAAPREEVRREFHGEEPQVCQAGRIPGRGMHLEIRTLQKLAQRKRHPSPTAIDTDAI